MWRTHTYDGYDADPGDDDDATDIPPTAQKEAENLIFKLKTATRARAAGTGRRKCSNAHTHTSMTSITIVLTYDIYFRRSGIQVRVHVIGYANTQNIITIAQKSLPGSGESFGARCENHSTDIAIIGPIL